ncbi:hypothetical protein N7470_000255 [Penicillium chermesinum]|nr:hypothetical protein N7470_000255 [Penicillium chermesinum]
MCADAEKTVAVNNDHLVQSDDPEHPANLIPALCRNFYNWGWVTGTGGGALALKPSDCTPLFLTAFEHGAACCIHTHSQWAVLITLLVEREKGPDGCFEINNIEQIKGIPRAAEDLTSGLEAAMNKYPDTYAVLVRRHGIYVWGDTVAKAKTQCESLDYLFKLAVEMHKLGLPWIK